MPNEKRSLVSVIMGICYKREDLSFLERSITSILKQSYRNIEVLICENGSTDAARVRLARFAEEDARVKLIDGKNTNSFSERLNRCLAETRGQLIARMDDDDFSDSDRLAIQIAYLQTHLDTDFVGCMARLERQGQPAGLRQLPERPSIQDFYMTQPYLHPTLVFRREALETVGGYSEDKRCILCEDYDLLLRLYAKGYVGANLQEVLFTYTLPVTIKGNRKMGHRWNETVTRWRRFSELNLFPNALPWVIKPLIVGLLPEKVLSAVKTDGIRGADSHG